MSLPVRTPRGNSKRQQLRQRNVQLATEQSSSPADSASSSLFGALRNAVNGPLSWLGRGFTPPLELSSGAATFDDEDALMTAMEEEEVGEKRRHHSPGPQPAAKRARHSSTPRAPAYNDPPAALFPPRGTALKGGNMPPTPSAPAVVPVKRGMVRSQSLALPISTSFGRAPLPSSGLRNNVERQMSVDSPSGSPEPSVKPHSRLFATRSVSISRYDDAQAMRASPMGHARSASRLTMSPAPSGASFGPLPARKSRDPSAPPLLAGTVDSRRSPFKAAIQRTNSVTSVPPSISASSTSFSALTSTTNLSKRPWNTSLTSMSSIEPSKPVAPQANAADLALQRANFYRTPLLASRLTQPVNHPRPAKVKVPIAMPEAEIGHFKKPLAREGGSPYNANESGIKRILARHREGEKRDIQVQVQQTRKEIAIGTDPESTPVKPAARTLKHTKSIMDVDEDDSFKVADTGTSLSLSAPTAGPSRAALIESPKASPARTSSAVSTTSAKKVSSSSSSLRAKTEFTKRNHASSKNKFSAVMEDDDDDENADLPTEEELMQSAPLEFKIPAGFSLKPMVASTTAPAFASAPAAPATASKPTPAVFSFPQSQPTITPSASISAFSFPSVPAPTTTSAPATTQSVAAKPLAAPSLFFATPAVTPLSASASEKAQHIPTSIFSSSFASSHPRSDVDNPMGATQPTTAPKPAAIPNFFATPPTPLTAEAPKPLSFTPSNPLFGGAAPAAAEKKDVAPASAPAPAASGFSFGSNLFGKPAAPAAPAPAPAAATTTAPPALSLFGATAPAAKSDAPQSFAGFGAMPQPIAAASTTTFAGFGKPAEPSKPVEPSKSFSFGTPSATPMLTPTKTADASMSMSTSSNTGLTTPPGMDTSEMQMQDSPERPPIANPFGLNTATSASTVAAPAGGSLFSFSGPPKLTVSTPSGGMFAFGASAATPGADAPKSPFATPAVTSSSVFTFGQTTSAPTVAASKPSTPAVASSPFNFGAPSTDKPAAAGPSPFAFGGSSQPAAATPAFGGSSQPAATTPAPFSFGQQPASNGTPAPFSFGSAATPTETPKATTPFGGFDSKPAASAPFSLVARASGSPAPQPASSTSFAFGAPNPAAPANPFSTTAPASPSFAFGQMPSVDAARASSPFATPQPLSQPQSPFATPGTFGSASPAPMPAPALASAPGFSFAPSTNGAFNNPFTAANAAGAGGAAPAFTMGAPDINGRAQKPMPRRRTQLRR